MSLPHRIEIESHEPEPVKQQDVTRGPMALRVETLYRGVVLGTRYLHPDPGGDAGARRARVFLAAGVALLLVAAGSFAVTAVEVARERRSVEAWRSAGKEVAAFPHRAGSPIAAALFFGGAGVGFALVVAGLTARARRRPEFLIGDEAGVDAPVPRHTVPSSAHPLVTLAGEGFALHVTPRMTGTLQLDGTTLALGDLIRLRGTSFVLPARGRARISCGETTFLLSPSDRPRPVPRALTWRRDEHLYTLGAGVGLGLFLLVIFAVPPDPKSLSLDMFGDDGRMFSVIIRPPVEEEPELLPWLAKHEEPAAGEGRRHQGTSGEMGKRDAKKTHGRTAIAGPPDTVDPHVAKNRAADRARNSGILAVLGKTMGSEVASIFARDATALGRGAEDVLGQLVGSQIAASGGLGGLGPTGTGAGGGGTGETTIGTGQFGFGLGSGPGGSGPGKYGRRAGIAGRLGPRAPKTPDIVIAHPPIVRGSLDKEIIRRVVRRHINEVKFCYDQELPRSPGLAGRVMVQFTIAATGQVLASALQSSNLGNVRVESCVVQATRRWEYPKPDGGGLVVVSYPFVFTPAGT